jgi:hypothetical protein
MLDANYVSDNTGDLSSLFDGSITNEVSVATMPMGTTEPTSHVILIKLLGNVLPSYFLKKKN